MRSIELFFTNQKRCVYNFVGPPTTTLTSANPCLRPKELIDPQSREPQPEGPQPREPWTMWPQLRGPQPMELLPMGPQPYGA